MTPHRLTQAVVASMVCSAVGAFAGDDLAQQQEESLSWKFGLFLCFNEEPCAMRIPMRSPPGDEAANRSPL